MARSERAGAVEAVVMAGLRAIERTRATDILAVLHAGPTAPTNGTDTSWSTKVAGSENLRGLKTIYTAITALLACTIIQKIS